DIMTRAIFLVTGVLLAIVFFQVESSWAQPKKQPPPEKNEWNVVLEKESELTFNDPIDQVQNERDKKGCRYKVHPIKMIAGRLYQIDMVSLTPTNRRGPEAQGKKWDNYLRLEDDKGVQLAYNDDIVRGVEWDARIQNFTPKRTGTYHIIATSFEPTEMGKYKLTVRVKGRRSNTDLDLSGGEDKLGGTLDKNDPLDKTRPFSRYKVHTANMTTGKTYQIDLMSKDFDPY